MDQGFVERTREYEFDYSKPQEKERTTGINKANVKRFVTNDELLPEHQSYSQPTTTSDGFVERTREFDYDYSKPKEQEHTAGTNKAHIKRFVNPEDCLPEQPTNSYSSYGGSYGGSYGDSYGGSYGGSEQRGTY